MKKIIVVLLMSLAILSCGIAGEVIEQQFSNSVFDGGRYETIGSLEQPTRVFSVLLSLEAAIVRDGTYMWACRHDNAKGELKWAFYRAGWNNNFGFYITTKPKPIFVHVPARTFARGMHSVAAVVTETEIRLYCDNKLLRTQSLEGYEYVPEKGIVVVGAQDAKKTNAFYGRIDMVKIVDFAMNPKQVEYAFGTPRRPTPKVFAVPMASVPEQTDKSFEPEQERDKWSALQVVDWRIAPETTYDELRQIATMIKKNGFNALFVSGSFRYLFAERYGDRNWWAAMPWTVYQQTLFQLNRACSEADLDFVLHLTANLGLYPDLEREFKGMVVREIDNPDKEIDWPNYYGRGICPNNAAFHEKYLARLRELFKTAPHLSGLMIDEISYGNAYTGCGCSTCRSLFQKRFGKEPPSPQDKGTWGNYASEAWRQWVMFRCDSVRNNQQIMADAVQNAKPNALFTGCNHNATEAHKPRLHGINPLRYAGNLLFYENEPCHPWSWRYGIAEGKYLQSDGRPLLMQGYSSSLSQAYFQLLFSAVMNWGNSQWTDFNQYRMIPVKWFSFYRPLGYGLSSAAEIALVVSPEDNVISDYNSTHGNVPMDYIGWVQVLTEHHILFDVIRIDNLAISGKKYQILVVPHTMCWSDNELDALQSFLNRGGRVFASPDSFSLTPDGAMRSKREWRGAMVELPECYGERYVMPRIGVGWYGNGGAWYDDRDKDIPKRMLEAIGYEPQTQVFSTNLPGDVVVNCDKQKYRDYEGFVIRMFNLTGTRASDGGFAVPGDKEYEFTDYPPLKENHWLGLRTAEPIHAAYMISPDFSERVLLDFTLDRDSGCVSVKLPGLARYNLIYLATKGNLLKDIAPNVSEIKGIMPTVEEFDVRWTSVR